MTVRIALIPLDERPANVRYPQMIAEIAGTQVLVPAAQIRGLQREPADLGAVSHWLRGLVRLGDVSAAVVSCDYLAYGNLINSRISNESAAAAIARLALLEEVGSAVPVYAFSLITRVSNADDDVEEPRYWREWGTKMYAYSKLAHMGEKGELSASDAQQLEALAAALPHAERSDWMVRRLRNHAVNLALVDMAARGRIASLSLTSDDTAANGFPTRERDALHGWLGLIGEAPASAIQMHPGADEVGSALVAKIVNKIAGAAPSVWVDYAIDRDKQIVAPYEDRPVRESVLGQIEACGCVPAASAADCDFVLGVVTPSPRRTDYRPEFLEPDRAERSAEYLQFLTRLGVYGSQGLPVAIADVAYPNGSDPLMSELLLSPTSPVGPGGLIGYGAWNTAGNTLGTVVAQASCALLIDGQSTRHAAHSRFLAHRFVEDYGYQQRVRREAREFAQARWGRREPDPSSLQEQQAVCVLIEERLSAVLDELQTLGIGVGLQIAAGSTRLPWHRTFEVDFELTPTGDSDIAPRQ